MNATAFEVSDPGYASRVQSSFERQRAMALLGATLKRVEPGRCEIHLPYRPELTQQHGYFHGGMVGTIADSAAGYACYTLAPAHSSVLTVEYKLNFVAPADGELLVVHGEVIKPGRTLVVSRADAYIRREGAETLCATMLQTLMILHGRADSPAGGSDNED